MSAASPVVDISQTVFDPFGAPEGWFATPRRLLALFKSDKQKNPRLMSLSQAALILFLENELWGDRRPDKHGKKAPAEWTKPLSLASIARACGITVQGIQPVIADAVDRGLIKRDGKKSAREPRYGLCCENWANCKGYVAKGKAAESEHAEDVESTTSGKDVATPVASSRVKPGQASTIEIAQTGQKLRCHNRVELEVEVAVTQAVDGLLELDIGVPREESGQLVSFPARSEATNPDVCSKPARSAPAARPSSEGGAAAVRDFLLARFVKNHATLSRQTLLRIWGAIQKSGANLEQYKELVRAREKRGKITAGTYVLIAEKDLAAYVEQQREVERKGPAVEPPDVDPKEARRQQRKQTVADYLRWKAQKTNREN